LKTILRCRDKKTAGKRSLNSDKCYGREPVVVYFACFKAGG
jgi:hypothetical protein